LNSLKHGLTATNVLLESELTGENLIEYNSILFGLEKDYAHLGPGILPLVRLIASDLWRLRRVPVVEAALTQLNIENRYQTEISKRISISPLPRTIHTMAVVLGMLPPASEHLNIAAIVCQEAIDFLEQGMLPEKVAMELLMCYSRERLAKIADQVSETYLRLAGRVDRTRQVNDRKETDRGSDIRLLSQQLSDLKTLFELQRDAVKIEENEVIREEVSLEVLPNEQDIARITRYETAILRSLEKKLKLLLEIEKSRGGRPNME
jgi:hypothetical protein